MLGGHLSRKFAVLGLDILTHNLEVCLENETSGGSSRLARVAFSSQSARAAVFNTPRHAMSSGRLETKKSGDFYWSKDEEPHAKRRREILEKYPEIKELYGPDWRTMPQIFAVVSAQLGLAYYLGNYASTPLMLLCAYLFGGFATANLFLANHELSHNLAFASPGANRALGLLANLPIGIPFSVAFKKYHLEHHMFQGHDSVDTDIPTKGEARLFSLGGTALKIVWVIGQLFFYAIRPLFLRPKPMGKWDALNLVTQLTFDLAFIKLAGPRAFTYLLASVFLGGGLHPIAGHFISEHYVFAPGQETYSYYGPLNAFVYNVGYHNEHHDFPKVPGSKLHRVREIAPEFYNHLHYHTSWTRVIFDYVTDPNMGPFSRTMRKKLE